MNSIISGYRRENGKLGVRNYVLLLPVDAVSYSICKSVENNVYGTIAIYHPYGRMQFGEDLELHSRTIIGTGKNPNVAAVIVIGIEQTVTENIANQIAESGKPVESFWSDGNGDFKTIERASRTAQKFVQHATSLKRTEADISELIIGYKCGESDTTSGLGGNPVAGVISDILIEKGSTIIFGETPELTGAEHILEKRFSDSELANKFLNMHREYLELIESKGVDLLGSQPTIGNMKGGITTIEEKAMGNIQKIGNTSITGVLDTAEEPIFKGLHFMNSSSAAADIVTAMMASGATLNLFVTGRGNNLGNPICPVVKLCANPNACESIPENIDVDISDLLTYDSTLNAAADKTLNYIKKVSEGMLTSAETLNHNEYAI